MFNSFRPHDNSHYMGHAKPYSTMPTKEKHDFLMDLPKYNLNKQFTNLHKGNGKQSQKTMAGISNNYPNNIRKTDNSLYYFEEDSNKVQEVSTHLHDVVQKLQNLQSPKNIPIQEAVQKANIMSSQPAQCKSNNHMADVNKDTQSSKSISCGVDVVDFRTHEPNNTSNDVMQQIMKTSKFLTDFFKPAKRTHSPKKPTKHRDSWHKTNDKLTNMDEDSDIEIGIEAYDTIPEVCLPHKACTLSEFITTAKDQPSNPISCQPIPHTTCINFKPTFFTISPPTRITTMGTCKKPPPTVSPICENGYVFISKEDCYSVSPLSRGSFIRRRIPSVTSEDSFVVFGNGNESDSSCGSSDEEDDTTDDYDYSSDDESIISSNDSDSDEIEQTVSPTTSKQKKVHFADEKNLKEVHVIVAWDFAYRSSRKGPWEQFTRDRERFKMRIERTSNSLQKILDPEHRGRIYKERFARDDARFG